MKPICNEKYKFVKPTLAPRGIQDSVFIVKSVSHKTYFIAPSVYNMLIEVNGKHRSIEITQSTWDSCVRPLDWFIKTGYYTVSMNGYEIAYQNEHALAMAINDRRSPFYISVDDVDANGMIRFMVNPSVFDTGRSYRIPVSMFHAIFRKHRQAEGIMIQDRDNYKFGPKSKFEFLKIKPTGITPAEMKNILKNIDETKVSVSFKFKNDQDRLDAIEFLKNMKVN